MLESLENIRKKAKEQFDNDILSLKEHLLVNPVYEHITETMLKLSKLPDNKKTPVEQMFFSINRGTSWELSAAPILRKDYMNIPSALDSLLYFLNYNILDDGIFHILKVKMSNDEWNEWYYFVDTIDDCNCTGRINKWRDGQWTIGNPFVVKQEFTGWFSTVENFANFLDVFYEIAAKQKGLEENPIIFDNIIEFHEIKE